MNMGSWAGWPRVWGYVAIFAIVAVINVVAFFGILRNGFLFSPFPGETTQSSLTSSSEVLVQQSLCRNDDIHTTGNNSRRPSSNFNPADREESPLHHHGGRNERKHSFFICVPILIGDDSSRPRSDALPFPLLYRLFDAAKEEISKKLQSDGKSLSRRSSLAQNDARLRIKLLVVVDFPSLVCKMARDSLQDAGPEFRAVELTCQTLGELIAAQAKPAATQSAISEKLSCDTVIVGKSTRFLPQLTLDWAQLLVWENLKVVDLDARDASHDPPRLPRELWQPTVITAFSSNHLAVGLLLLRSLGRAGMELAKARQYNISIVAYALEDFNSTLQGILDCVVRDLNENYSVPTELRAFDFSAHPDWMRVNQSMGYDGTGKWAWKAVMIHDLLVERGFVLWTDAGCRYTASSLLETLNNTRDFGFASKLSVGAVPQYVHPGQIKYFRYQVRYGPTRVLNCDTSGIGLTLDTYESIGRPFYDCSVTRQCIGPDGATRDDHRFEQAAMTLIADMNGTSCKGLSAKVRRHMDYRPRDYSGTFPTHCYKDPLPVPGT